MGYRNINTTNPLGKGRAVGTAVGEEPESMYSVVAGNHFNNHCCFVSLSLRPPGVIPCLDGRLHVNVIVPLALMPLALMPLALTPPLCGTLVA
jgi:hypothetical protein